jgi:hydrogenase maturation factor
MKPEIFFLKYAFPCSFVLLSRKEIDSKDHELLYKSTKEEKLYLPIEKIEKIFWRAVEFVGSISNLDAAQKYWWFDHNKHLKTKKIKNLDEKLLKECMVIPCEVISISENRASVKSPFLSKIIELKTDFVNVKPGDKVTKHYDYLSEKIPENLCLKIEESLKKLGFNKSQ